MKALSIFILSLFIVAFCFAGFKASGETEDIIEPTYNLYDDAYGQSSARKLITFQAVSEDDGVTFDAIGDYSDTTIFSVTPPAGKKWSINRLIVGVEDTGTLDAGFYGNGISITNGVQIRIKQRRNGDRYLLNPVPIKTNSEWAMFCHDVTRHSWGSGNEVLSVRYTFGAHGHPIILEGSAGDEIEILLSDDYSGLVHHYFTFEGYEF